MRVRWGFSVLGLAFLGCFAAFTARRAGPKANADEVVYAEDNGDVNGDRQTNLSDAVYLLNWLFSGGPAPVPMAPVEELPSLPDTGQRNCSANGVTVECVDDLCPGQDGAWETGCPPDGRFTDNGDGTVTDTCTGLMWLGTAADIDGDGEIEPGAEDGDRVAWCEALDFSEAFEYAGHEDWRLPNVRELESIIDYGLQNPSIDPVFECFSAAHWTSTSSAGHPSRAWVVYFANGDTYLNDKSPIRLHLRPVRDAL